MTDGSFSRTWLILPLLLGLAACGGGGGGQQESISPEDSSTGWSIPVAEVQDGGPGKDGIPAIDAPVLVDVAGFGNGPPDRLHQVCDSRQS